MKRAAEIGLAARSVILVKHLAQMLQRLAYHRPVEVHIVVVDDERPVIVALVREFMPTPGPEQHERRSIGQAVVVDLLPQLRKPCRGRFARP